MIEAEVRPPRPEHGGQDIHGLFGALRVGYIDVLGLPEIEIEPPSPARRGFQVGRDYEPVLRPRDREPRPAPHYRFV